MTRLHDRLRTALSADRERWHRGLAAEVSTHAWRALARKGIDRGNYGTARVLLGDPAAARNGETMLDAGLGRATPLERYDTCMLARYGIIGLREPGHEFDPAFLEDQIRQALDLISLAPGALEAVQELVWSVTPVGVEGPDYDTGYSDPAVPFSIFIGAHPASDHVPPIRLAEGVLHETMHLQLSLMEELVPLVGGGTEQRFSPWQERPRPTQGILHGLYVFRVVQDWLRACIVQGALAERDCRHARSRIEQIDRDCFELSDLASSQDLTDDGKRLASALAR